MNAVTRARLARDERQHTVGGFVVSPGEVQARARELDGHWTTLSNDMLRVVNAGPVTPDQEATFSAFGQALTSWQTFFAANKDTFWTAGSVADALDGWQKNLSDWQTKLAEVGVKPSGIKIDPTPPKLDPFAGLVTALKWTLGIAAAAVIGAIAVDRTL